MRRLISISLAVLLAMGLSIMVFPAQAVEASRVPEGAAFHIHAEGEGDYLYQYPGSESGTGEFFINVAGQKGYGYKFNYGRGYGTPQDTVQGHIRGSFGEHEIDVILKNPPGYGTLVHLDSAGRLKRVGFKFKGTYDGNKVISHQSYIRVYYDEYGELDYILADLCFTDGTTQTFLDVTMYDASVDLHQNPN